MGLGRDCFEAPRSRTTTHRRRCRGVLSVELRRDGRFESSPCRPERPRYRVDGKFADFVGRRKWAPQTAKHRHDLRL
jgi:hypothetical protein